MKKAKVVNLVSDIKDSKFELVFLPEKMVQEEIKSNYQAAKEKEP